METNNIEQKLEGSSNAGSTIAKKSLAERLKEQQDAFKPAEEETIQVVISDIRSTRNEGRVLMITSVGNLFAFSNTFEGGVPIGVKSLKAELTLRENIDSKGVSHVNIVRVKYNLEDIGKYAFVATQKLSVAL